MAAHKLFRVTYTFDDSTTATIQLKAPRFPTNSAIDRAVKKAGMILPVGEGHGFIIEKCDLSLASGSSSYSFCWAQFKDNDGRRDKLLYTRVISEIA